MKKSLWVLVFIIVINVLAIPYRGYSLHIDHAISGISFDLPDDWNVTYESNGLSAVNEDRTMEMVLKRSPIQNTWKGVESYLKAVLLTNHGTNVQLQKTYGLTLNDVYLIAREFNFEDENGKPQRGAIAIIQTLQGYSYIYAYSKVGIDGGMMADLFNFSQTVRLYKKTIDHKKAHLQVAIPFTWSEEWFNAEEVELLKVSISNKSFLMYVGYIPQVNSRKKAMQWLKQLDLTNSATNLVWSAPRDEQLESIPVLIQSALVPKKQMTEEEKGLQFRISLTNANYKFNYDAHWVAERTILYTGKGLAFTYIVYNSSDCRKEWKTIRHLKDYYKLID